MLETIRQYLEGNWLLAISTPFYAILIALEIVLSNSRKLGFYSLKETLINFWLNLANTALNLAFKTTILLIFTWAFQWSIFHWQPSVVYWITLFILLDLCFYFEHRAEHYSRILWAVHVTHHSSTEFNLTTGFRSSVFRPFVSLWFFLPLAFLGFRPLDILLMDAICQIYGILVHTQFVKRMPVWFEAVFVSPSHHRVHHACNVRYLDKNMGMALIIWDRFFGTFQEELIDEKPVYGLTKNPEHRHHPFWIILHEWSQMGKDLLRMRTFQQAIQLLLYPPGWSPDGSTKTSRQLREELNKPGV